jgi:hypothetical protein
MAGFSAFAPPCMVAGPNGLDLKKIQMRVKFKICFKFRLKIKKIVFVGSDLPLPPTCAHGST